MFNVFNFLSFTELKLLHFLFAGLILFCGYWLARWTGARVAKLVEKMMSKHESILCQRFIFYGSMLLFVIAALQQLGFKLGVLLGAAGVFTVGMGFAAQTSLANLISGIFLLMERPFKIGDTISAKGFTGVVESIDLISTRLSTVDNTLVRIPNENIMQVEIINLSYFPQRRVDLILGIAYGTSFDKVQTVLLQLAQENVLALQDPEPKVSINNFGPSTIDIKFSVWGLTINYLNLKNSLQEAIKVAFEKEKIDMPFPQMTIHSVVRKNDEKLDTSTNSA